MLSVFRCLREFTWLVSKDEQRRLIPHRHTVMYVPKICRGKFGQPRFDKHIKVLLTSQESEFYEFLVLYIQFLDTPLRRQHYSEWLGYFLQVSLECRACTFRSGLLT